MEKSPTVSTPMGDNPIFAHNLTNVAQFLKHLSGPAYYIIIEVGLRVPAWVIHEFSRRPGQCG
jgi:hypothetical protein